MAKVNIHRKKSFSGSFKDFHIFLDDKELGNVSLGQTVEYDVPPGNYQLKCKMNKSKFGLYNGVYDLNITDGETKYLSVGISYYYYIVLFAGITMAIGISEWVKSHHEVNQNLRFTFVIPWLLFFYIFRNKMLMFKEA